MPQLSKLSQTIFARFQTYFPGWFGCLLVLCIVHRLFAIRHFYHVSFFPTYTPKDMADTVRLWFEIYGESTVLGLSYDVIFAAILAGLVIFLPRVLRFVVMIALAVFFAANVDHIKYNHSHITFSTAHLGANTTFIEGMLTQTLVLRVAILIVTGTLTLALLRLRFLRVFWIATGSMALIAALFIPVQGNFVHPSWMQSSPLLGSPLSATDGDDDRQFASSILAPHAPIARAQQGPNVLVVYMEGLSHLSMDIGEMAVLSELADDNIQFSRYIGPQLITANGLFSSLSGNLPNMARSDLKWDSGLARSELLVDALPARLQAQGYHTAFLQSAPLGFMSKDEIMPRFGFEIVQGNESWDQAYSANAWGIDDRTLFENTLAYVDTLDPQKPWFVSILTTGTHAPYNVPAAFLPDAGSDRYRALRYLDAAIGELVTGLAERGMLENTVVVLTSDESREVSTAGSLQGELALNWLPLVVLHPSGQSILIDDYVSAADMPNILVALQNDNITTAADIWKPRDTPLVFGNVYSNRMYVFEPQDDSLLACETRRFVCAQFDDMPDPFVATDRAPDQVAYFPSLQQLVLENEARQ